MFSPFEFATECISHESFWESHLIGVLLGFGFLFLPFAYSGSREVFHLTSLDLSLWWVLLIMIDETCIEIVKKLYLCT